MSLFTFHLAKTTFKSALKVFRNPPDTENVPGLIHAECMTSNPCGIGVFFDLIMKYIIKKQHTTNMYVPCEFLTQGKFKQHIH